ncbi:putative calcium-transporting ATPase 13, plasma membrane-type isoform X2 [Solanum stenotomum]|uniref:putative calcium-transporting ATPase 13, plasma membrane-type isoform X2 n=1 Tax=Solanum stenotomum TaxID=172797 RepID=UPI0020D069F4|nr:putative calcium-transporting ATPase 13, plasma membrane-type isoform X2 [Solanum stenotomum]
MMFQANLHYLCMNITLDLSSEVDFSSQKRWHVAFATIFCSRAFKINTSTKALHGPAYNPRKVLGVSTDTIAIDVVEDHPFFSGIDQSSLAKLVKDKNIDELANLGGVQGVADSLKTDTTDGVSGDPEDVARRHEVFGRNMYRKPPAKSFFIFLWESLKDPTNIKLLLWGALSLVLGIMEHGPKEGWYDGGSIYVAGFLVIAVSSISKFRQNRQFDKLSKVSKNIPVEAVRKGRRQQISIFEIVVGDVICLKIGDQVPADGILVQGHSLQVDESSMTGESDHVEINISQNPFLISGTKVVDGYGMMLVTSVDMNTTWGEMMSEICSDSNEHTPLQERLDMLTSLIDKVGLLVAFLVLIVQLVQYFTGSTVDENGFREFNGIKTSSNDVINAVVGIFASAVTIIVAAIPEGLPLAVTLTLTYSMKRMMADQAMVRKLSACEIMGSVTTICTDKTGTLTLNKMTVTKFFLGKDHMKAESHTSISAKVLELLHQGVGLNTTGSVFKSSDPCSSFEFSGSPTEKAILSWAVMELNMDMDQIKRNFNILHVEAFNSDKKKSGVLIKNITDGTFHAHWKGAAEMISRMCSHYYDLEGNVKPFEQSDKEECDRIIEGMAASSLRCIAFAHKQVPKAEQEDREHMHGNVPDNSFILLGFVGLKDPCRPGMKKAVEDCQNAGVNIKMITGDNVFTAKAIATECGILHPNQEVDEGAVIEGVEFRSLTDEERMERVEMISVMARSSPFDKLLMVQCLRKKGHVVAVTGDGANDAPALKEADIGLSMGIQGTEVAKESSDIVILDDNFASVATVLKWGRCVYNNIQKFIQFQLTANVAALVINFVASVSYGEEPLTSVQLLWVNLIMDTLGALALATEKPTEEVMKKKPVGRTAPLITNIMWRNLMAQASYQIAVLLTLLYKGESIFGVNKSVNDTLFFNTFVLCQVFNEFNTRNLEKKNVFEGIQKNKLFMAIIGLTLVLQVVMVEFLKKFANTERLNWGQWGICIGFAAASWPIGWLVKCITVPERPIFSYLRLNYLKALFK